MIINASAVSWLHQSCLLLFKEDCHSSVVDILKNETPNPCQLIVCIHKHWCPLFCKNYFSNIPRPQQKMRFDYLLNLSVLGMLEKLSIYPMWGHVMWAEILAYSYPKNLVICNRFILVIVVHFWLRLGSECFV